MAVRHPGRFAHVQYDNLGVEQQATMKGMYEELEKRLNMFFPDAPNAAYGRAKALCLTALEESFMWAGKSVRDAQVARANRPLDEAPNREQG